MSLNSTPRTWSPGEVVTATELNTEIRDAFNGIQSAWTSFTPQWQGSVTNPTIGNGSIIGRWQQIGKMIDATVLITGGSTTNWGSGNYVITLPIGITSTLNVSNFPIGTGLGNPAGTSIPCVANIVSAASIRLTYAGGNVLANSTGAWASGNIIAFTVRYESA